MGKENKSSDGFEEFVRRRAKEAAEGGGGTPTSAVIPRENGCVKKKLLRDM